MLSAARAVSDRLGHENDDPTTQPIPKASRLVSFRGALLPPLENVWLIGADA